jgi:hypothetical protein
MHLTSLPSLAKPDHFLLHPSNHKNSPESPFDHFILTLWISHFPSMSASEILAILDRLNHAYPDKRRDKRTMKVYLDELSDIPAELLHQAASQHIRTSPYFPRIADLRLIAHQLAGTANFASLASPAVDYLDLQAFQLHTAYFQHGVLDPQAWQRLLRQFENVGRSCRAEELRRQLEHIQQIQAAHARGEEWPPLEQRQRYHDWEILTKEKGDD